MRVAFYSPMVEADASAASGAHRMATLLCRALAGAGYEVLQPSLPRTYDGAGDPVRQAALREASDRAAAALLRSYGAGHEAKPDLWFSYHVYYKSPDWIGPNVAQALGIPYAIAEGSHAPKRAGGPWALGHDGTTAALRAADRLFAMTSFDRYCLDQIAPGRVRDLKPFIDIGDQLSARAISPREGCRVIAVGMMRNERKRASYGLLAEAWRLLEDAPLSLTIVGDGRYRGDVEQMFAGRRNVRFAGAVEPARVASLMAEADIFAWPGLGEAYGLVFLEAQAMGLPVAACRDRGVPDATFEGRTTLLSAAGDAAAFAANVRRLARDANLRASFGAAGRALVASERSVAAAARTLKLALSEIHR